MRTLAVLVILCLSFYSCDKNEPDYFIEKGKIAGLTKAIKVHQLDSVFPNDSIVKHTREDDFYGSTAQQIKLYDKTSKTLKLLLTPSAAFDSLATIEQVEVLDTIYKTRSGLGLGSPFGIVKKNYKISGIENTLNNAVVRLDTLDMFFTIDKSHLPSNIKFDSGASIDAMQIPDDAPIKNIYLGWYY